MPDTRRTIDHNEIRQWVEKHGGFPATVKETHEYGEAGLLRVDYPGFDGNDTLERISWDEWFRGFDNNQLSFLYQDESDSRFSQLVSRDGGER